jgi:hypothetical protein
MFSKNLGLSLTSHVASVECSFKFQLLACGYYELNETTGSRSGSIELRRVDDLAMITNVESESGVLDMKWSDNALAVATSGGKLDLHLLDFSGRLASSQSVENIELGLFLSTDVVRHPKELTITTSTQVSCLSFFLRVTKTCIRLNLGRNHIDLSDTRRFQLRISQ